MGAPDSTHEIDDCHDHQAWCDHLHTQGNRAIALSTDNSRSCRDDDKEECAPTAPRTPGIHLALDELSRRHRRETSSVAPERRLVRPGIAPCAHLASVRVGERRRTLGRDLSAVGFYPP